MQRIAAFLIRVFVRLMQALPLTWVAAAGRFGGWVAWTLRVPHRKVALDNLTKAFPEKPAREVQRIARENLLRIGENYASALKTAAFTVQEVARICSVVGLEKFPHFTRPDAPRNCIVAIGHFGNFELYATMAGMVAGLQGATTYRGLDQPAFNEIMTMLRNKSGCRFFERRSDAGELKAALNAGGILLGLLSDQHAGRSGVWGPLFGRICSTTPAPAVFAMRYDAPLYTAICYRKGLGKWQIEIGDQIATEENGKTRPIEAVVEEMNAAFEQAIRRDPANWFWVHKRWKKPPAKITSALRRDAESASPGTGAELL